MIDTVAIKARFEALAPFLGERDRRLWAASEAYAAGRGGILAVSTVSHTSGVARPWRHSSDSMIVIWPSASKLGRSDDFGC